MYIRQAMNTLPEGIQDARYEYEQQIQFHNVMDRLKGGVCYCGRCGDRQWASSVCNCMDDSGDCDDNDSYAEYYDYCDSDCSATAL